MNKRSNLKHAHSAGKSQGLFLGEDIKSTALYGGLGDCYRYKLCRVWDKTKPRIMWIMMNPSVATEKEDDRTVAKCQRLSRKWGYGSMNVGNSFAYRCTDQKRLLEVSDPVGKENLEHLLKMAQESDCVLLAYGTPQAKMLQAQGTKVAKFLADAGINLYALKLSTKNRPCHPLYLSETLKPIPFVP
ncbi:DUF1643 domain-containing protein [Acetobacteraceae bacterium]|nr:DUF1643 domain-containing protein [Acetobacteraceae bacterium]